MEEKKHNKKRKIRFKGILIIVLFFYLLGTFMFYLWKMPIKNIEIDGNYYLKDNYLKNYLNLEGKSVLQISKNKIKKELLKLDLISDVKIKKDYFGKIYITVVEDKILFYNLNNKKIVLSSGKEVDYNDNYLGVPTLINYVPDEIYKELIERLNLVNKDTLALVSEIEYKSSIVNDKVVDDKRFLFRMNDGNMVYINTINIEKFNNYLEIYEAIVNKNGDIKGCLYLDSNSENNHFNNCETPVVEEDNDGEN